MSNKQRGKRRRPDLDTVYTINTDGSRNFLHPADVRGLWQNVKRVVFLLLIAVYAGVPFVRIGGRPLVHLDLPGRAAHLFGQSFSNQDFYLVFFLASGMGFGLFVVTSMLGRVWCGYACPQTVLLEGVYRRVERWIEGPRNRRIGRNLGPLTFDKSWRKALKHALFIVLSYLIAHVFLAYFIPYEELLEVVRSHPSAHKSAFFWSMFWTGVLYFNYSWFREQTCLIICPYGRLQSALIDDQTVIIGYDEARGEPRVKATESGGDCVDCYRCVEVCPTGIDIRNGLQMECIGCANCIDACDEVMDRLERPRGLVRYDSQVGLEGGKRRMVRPRVWVYLFMGLLGLTVFGAVGMRRQPFDVDAVRMAGMPYSMVDGKIRNLFALNVQNKDDRSAVFTIELLPDPDGIDRRLSCIVSQPRLALQGMAAAQVPIFVDIPQDVYTAPFVLNFGVTDSVSGHAQTLELRFRGP